jgi:hypothetical protein
MKEEFMINALGFLIGYFAGIKIQAYIKAGKDKREGK